jgi:hypothetical protein
MPRLQLNRHTTAKVAVSVVGVVASGLLTNFVYDVGKQLVGYGSRPYPDWFLLLAGAALAALTALVLRFAGLWLARDADLAVLQALPDEIKRRGVASVVVADCINQLATDASRRFVGVPLREANERQLDRALKAMHYLDTGCTGLLLLDRRVVDALPDDFCDWGSLAPRAQAVINGGKRHPARCVLPVRCGLEAGGEDEKLALVALAPQPLSVDVGQHIEVLAAVVGAVGAAWHAVHGTKTRRRKGRG